MLRQRTQTTRHVFKGALSRALFGCQLVGFTATRKGRPDGMAMIAAPKP
jgi:hypothetical protein